ncbi:YihY/virulence factor BrkB family protein [Actinoplanes sp. NPDC051470]|uniref:YihY/virulence factor BrkB family protein n=1 Tax=Actinoplanes sp. NPDC051470 TaxID=3157224 RepID=UPI00342081F2
MADGRPASAVDRAYDAIVARLMVWRHRSKYFDHFSRAILRYDEVNGGRLAAAIAYYGFFAVFALLLIGYSIFGILLGNNDDLFDIVREFLAQNLPFLDLQQVLDSGRAVGIIGLVGLVWTGLGWVDAIRSSQRLIWRVNEHPGFYGIRQLVDLGVLLGILVLVGLSVGAVNLLERLLTWLSDGHAGWLLTTVSWIAMIAINMLLAAALLAAVPRLRMTVRRMIPPVLQVGVGITLLNTVGKYLVGLVERNPAYGLVASAVGVLFYLYLFNQVLLFGAAWAATSPHGRVVDLAADDKTAPVGQNTWIRHHSP